MTPEQIAEILDSHQKWINNNEGERAKLYGANLSPATQTKHEEAK